MKLLCILFGHKKLLVDGLYCSELTGWFCDRCDKEEGERVFCKRCDNCKERFMKDECDCMMCSECQE